MRTQGRDGCLCFSKKSPRQSHVQDLTKSTGSIICRASLLKSPVILGMAGPACHATRGIYKLASSRPPSFFLLQKSSFLLKTRIPLAYVLFLLPKDHRFRQMCETRLKQQRRSIMSSSSTKTTPETSMCALELPAHTIDKISAFSFPISDHTHVLIMRTKDA